MDKNKLGDDLPRVQTEMKALRALHHPSICRLYERVNISNTFYYKIYVTGGQHFTLLVTNNYRVTISCIKSFINISLSFYNIDIFISFIRCTFHDKI